MKQLTDISAAKDAGERILLPEIARQLNQAAENWGDQVTQVLLY